ncbi:Rhodanese-like domain [Dillenia turbinata]|uniref:Rhodanese-like domain n=1 Tax=Dillenia turbinata TaxID=194707 RepID=A0AAN8V6S2_9MAGN
MLVATSFVTSVCFTRSLLPLLHRPHQSSSLTTNLRFQPCGFGSSTLLRNSHSCQMGFSASAKGNVESTGVPTSVPVRVAHELLLAGHKYLDVRTPEEFSAGHVTGAINITYMFKAGSGMTKNPKFIEEVSLRFRKNDEIIVGCQLGKRSFMAATDLLSAFMANKNRKFVQGFTGITDIAGGYAAWTQTGLPTEQ